MTARGEEGESTFATYLYARYRGRTKLDMVTPLYWHYEDPDIGLSSTLVFPFLVFVVEPPRVDDRRLPFLSAQQARRAERLDLDHSPLPVQPQHHKAGRPTCIRSCT